MAGSEGGSCLVGLMSISLIVVGALGIAGHIPNPTLGWTVTGLGGGLLLASCCGARASALYAAVILTMGILGGTNVITAHSLGWTIVGIEIALLAIMLCAGSCLIAMGGRIS